MGWFEILAAAIVGGSALGATIAGFFAYQQKSRVTVLREIAEDYEKRIKQLEEERTKDKARIIALEAEKRLPLDQLTQLIIEQHSAQMEHTQKLADSMTSIAKQMARVVSHIAPSGDAA